MRWSVSHRFDPRGARFADRHYSRQKPGTPQFVGNGSGVVLIAPRLGEVRGLWVTKWQRFVRTEWWLDTWVCSLFRNEGLGLSSELITEAVAATRAVWGDPPRNGFTTFVDAQKTRRKRDPGRCYRKAGWNEVGETKAGLIVLRLSCDDFPEPAEPIGYQRTLLDVPKSWANVLSQNLTNEPEAA
jgi:hypothetical protein